MRTYASRERIELHAEPDILYDVVRITFDDLLRFRKSYNHNQNIDTPDRFKEAAHIAYWIRRLKPLSYRYDVEQSAPNTRLALFINEIIALVIAGYICSFEKPTYAKDEKWNLPKPCYLREDLLYMFRYKHISPHALIFILQGIYN
ncbi:MAG: hypothetical protein HY886_09220 [Deltaproteobacteria bacterium]|nr:hypothetical protein [Deltaproteobacteria bacterium]